MGLVDRLRFRGAAELKGEDEVNKNCRIAPISAHHSQKILLGGLLPGLLVCGRSWLHRPVAVADHPSIRETRAIIFCKREHGSKITTGQSRRVVPEVVQRVTISRFTDDPLCGR
ncbi:hypothetical protein I7I51_03073, partial [Histoplasma capsulatum]